MFGRYECPVGAPGVEEPELFRGEALSASFRPRWILAVPMADSYPPPRTFCFLVKGFQGFFSLAINPLKVPIHVGVRVHLRYHPGVDGCHHGSGVVFVIGIPRGI